MTEKESNDPYKHCKGCGEIIGIASMAYEAITDRSRPTNMRITRQFYKCNICGKEEDIKYLEEQEKEYKMNEADARQTLRSEVGLVFSSNKWQPRFKFNIENSLELADDIANAIFDNCKHCFKDKRREWPPKDDKECHLKIQKGFGVDKNKMNYDKAKDLIIKLRTDRYDAVIFDPTKEVPKQKLTVIVRRKFEQFQCYICFNFKEEMTGKHFTEFCKAGLTVPIEGVHCPMFKLKYGTVLKNENELTQDFLEKHVDLVIRKTLIVSARDLLIKACKGTDDPLYEVYRKLETDFIEHFNAHKI